jgi:hypothetical protein
VRGSAYLVSWFRLLRGSFGEDDKESVGTANIAFYGSKLTEFSEKWKMTELKKR